mgnify:CR=1 FL=1
MYKNLNGVIDHDYLFKDYFNEAIILFNNNKQLIKDYKEYDGFYEFYSAEYIDSDTSNLKYTNWELFETKNGFYCEIWEVV